MANEQDLKRMKEEEQRVARKRQELAENKREIAQALYQYQGPVLFGGGCTLLPNDYMMYQNGNMFSTRGSQISMTPEQLADMINAGAVSKVFDPDDLNAPDFMSKIDTVLNKMTLQSDFKDASTYYRHPQKDLAVAVFADKTGQAACYVLRNENDVIIGSKLNLDTKEDYQQLRECTYEEYNPGAKDLREQIKAINPERENKTSAYEKMLEEYQQNGSNNVKSPGEILKDKTMSAADKMNAYVAAKDQEDKQREIEKEAREKVEEDEFSLLPKSMQNLGC